MISLAGKSAVITGGSRGIGAAAVKLFAAAGANVVFNYRRSRAAAMEVAREAAGAGVEVVPLRADVRRMADARRLVRTAVRRFGRLDILVANAGIWNVREAPIERMREREWDEMMDVNLKGTYTVVHFAAQQMIRQKSGRIICISSTAGQRGEAFHSHYGATKGGIISLVKGLSTELARHNILVNAVAPGWVDTEMSRPVLRNQREVKKVLATIPLGRVATAEEIAGPILFLASDLANFMTGEIVNVNGGAVLVG